MFTIYSDYGYFKGVPDGGYTTFARALRWSFIRAERLAKQYGGRVEPSPTNHGYIVIDNKMPTVSFFVGL